MTRLCAAWLLEKWGFADDNGDQDQTNRYRRHGAAILAELHRQGIEYAEMSYQNNGSERCPDHQFMVSPLDSDEIEERATKLEKAQW